MSNQQDDGSKAIVAEAIDDFTSRIVNPCVSAYFYCATKEDVDALVAEFNSNPQYTQAGPVQSFGADEPDEDGQWYLNVDFVVMGKVDFASLQAMAPDMDAIAARHNATYDGWEVGPSTL